MSIVATPGAVQGHSSQDLVVSFGKHKGKSIKQVDDVYLWWIQSTLLESTWRKTAFQVLEERKQPGTQSRKWTLLDELKVCITTRNLQRGKEIHAEAMESENDSCIYLGTALINMYAKCGSMASAQQVFDSVKHPHVMSWNALIAGYADNGEGLTAFDLFSRMKSQGCAPDSFTFVAALKACISLASDQRGGGKRKCLRRGKEVHSQINCKLDIYLQSNLINMYAKCGSMIDARQVFDSVKHPNVVAWSAIILGYADNGEGDTALDLLARMRSKGCAPNSFTLVAAVKACTSLAVDQNESGRAECLKRGKDLHSEIGCNSDIRVQNTLISMYAKCGSMTDARQVFDDMRTPNVVSWNALMSGYADNGEGTTALDLFARMRSQGCAPNSLSFVAALKACASLDQNKCLKRIKDIHSQIDCQVNIYVHNTLIDMYAKFGSMIEAREVFDRTNNPNVVSWNTLIMGYAESGEGGPALEMFARMKSQGFEPDTLTFVAALKACGSFGDATGLERGKEIHSQISCQFEMHLPGYLQSSLIDMYSKCGSMSDARRVFDSTDQRDVVSWNALILGYARNGESVLALDLFSKMRSQGCTPTCVTFVAALKACGLLGALESGTKIHAEIDTEMFSDTILVTSLVDFYAKCGNLVEAQKVFDSHPNSRNLITWNALLAGYSCIGDTKTVFELFDGILDSGIQPDGVTCICILRCCSHAGLAAKGKEFLEGMPVKYNITPTLEHFTCLIDILGRLNKLDDAVELLESMPCRPNATTWMTILGACHKWKNVETGRLAFKALVSLDETNAAAYVFMAHIYGSRGMLEEKEMVLAMGKEIDALKEPGQTYWINEEGEVHTFFVT